MGKPSVATLELDGSLPKGRPWRQTPVASLRMEAIMRTAGQCAVIVAMLAAMLCSSAPEAAAQPQPIVGCVKAGTGLLRIPPPGEGCKAQETPLGFNDLPLLVALRTQVEQLQRQVRSLEERLVQLEACTSSIPECNPE